MVDQPVDRWDAFSSDLERLRRGVAESRATRIGRSSLRNQARRLVQDYFREVRPELEGLEVDPVQIKHFDEQMQGLLTLANGRNRRTSYVRTLGKMAQTRQAIELERELRLGQVRSRVQHTPHAARSAVEQAMLETLRALVPTAALSYEQALHDLADADRVSYKGTANELREALREVLDHLAPDDEVTRAPGFSYEKGRTQPTHRQKVQYVLKSRGLSRTASRPAVQSAGLVDQLVADITRTTYDRSSLATHVSSTRGEVQQLKMYVDSVLAELLEIHQGQETGRDGHGHAGR
jgi:hypothetical protein